VFSPFVRRAGSALEIHQIVPAGLDLSPRKR
jgi:hypothetical protein